MATEFASLRIARFNAPVVVGHPHAHGLAQVPAHVPADFE